jgi:lycopene cyclase domain-containing protein
LWLLLLARHLPVTERHITASLRLRRLTTAVIFVVWLAALAILVSGWQPGTYLGLLLVWALPPVMLQTAFGADILWSHRRIVLLSVIPMTLYLSAVDKLAITSGTWTINPEQSVNILLLGRLPLEEFIFFFMTNTLIALGITLVTSAESRIRAESCVRALRRRLAGRPVLPHDGFHDSLQEG